MDEKDVEWRRERSCLGVDRSLGVPFPFPEILSRDPNLSRKPPET